MPDWVFGSLAVPLVLALGCFLAGVYVGRRSRKT